MLRRVRPGLRPQEGCQSTSLEPKKKYNFYTFKIMSNKKEFEVQIDFWCCFVFVDCSLNIHFSPSLNENQKKIAAEATCCHLMRGWMALDAVFRIWVGRPKTAYFQGRTVVKLPGSNISMNSRNICSLWSAQHLFKQKFNHAWRVSTSTHISTVASSCRSSTRLVICHAYSKWLTAIFLRMQLQWPTKSCQHVTSQMI